MLKFFRSITYLIMILSIMLFPIQAYTTTIDQLLSEDSSKSLINKMCKLYTQSDDFHIFINIANKFLAKTNSGSNNDALSGLKGYILTLNILYADRTIETTYTMLNDGFELRQKLEPTIQKLLKRGILSGNLKNISEYYNKRFIPWAIPYIKKQCGFKF